MSKIVSFEKLKLTILNFFKKNRKTLEKAMILGCFIFCTGFSQEYSELEPLINLLKFFIDLIKYCSAIIGGAIVTISGWNIMVNTNGQGIKSAKSNLSNALIGLILVFFGSSIASFLIEKIMNILN